MRLLNWMNKSERDMQIQKVDTGSKSVLVFVHSVNNFVLFSFGWSHGKVRWNVGRLHE